MSLIWGALGFLAAALIVREIAAYLPAIARWQINRGLKRLPDAVRPETRDKWLAIDAKLPGDLTKVLWGVGCNWILVPAFGKPATPERVAKIVHLIWFYIYLRMVVSDLIRLNFATPRQLIVRWKILKIIVDQGLVAGDPNAPRPLLELADKLQNERFKQQATIMVDAMRKRRQDQ